MLVELGLSSSFVPCILAFDRHPTHDSGDVTLDEEFVTGVLSNTLGVI